MNARMVGATDGRCCPSEVEDQYERCLGGHEGLAPVTDRLGLGCGGVGARSGAAGESIGVECAEELEPLRKTGGRRA